MKKIISIMLALFVLLTSGCSLQNGQGSSITSSSIGTEKEKLDIMKEALSLVSEDYLNAFDSANVSENSFEDLTKLYKNPLSAADYIMSYKKPCEEIADLKTAVDFSKFVLSENTFKLEKKSADYKVYDDINDSLNKLFNLFETTDGLDKAKEDFKAVEPRVAKAISHYISASIEAYKIISEQTKNISPYDFYKCQQLMYCPPQNEGDKKAAFNEVLEICKNVDSKKMLTAFDIMLSAADNLRVGIRYNNNLTENGEQLTVNTPLGAICLGTNGDDVYRSPCALLIIDLNGDDEYLGKIAAGASLTQPISVVLDLGGNDIYDNNGYTATQGSGILGVGILVDNNGDDIYTARSFSQGAALFGGGALIDVWGNDTYTSSTTSQASGYFGSAFLFDLNGNDKYSALGYSQAFAGDGAVCVLADKNGNDKYLAQPKLALGYEDMQFENYNAAANFSQGCAVNGAVAGLIDLSGYDEYKGGVWVQGVGYNGGLGFVSDYQGNDRYFSNCNSQAAADGFSVGTLLDIGGDDAHVVSKLDADALQGQCLGYAVNGGIAQFIDDFGNDFYYTHNTSFGTINSQNEKTTFAAFIDTEGDDVYHVLYEDKSFGYGKGAIFIDGNGIDEYKNTNLLDADKLFGADRNSGVFWDIELPEKPKKDDPQFEFTFLAEAKEEHLPAQK